MDINGLSLIVYGNEKVITSKQLAEIYGVDSEILNKNFSRNRDRYVEGVHFFKLQGETLIAFKDAMPELRNMFHQAKSLFLWTEKGCFLHSKSLGTDEAWDVYEKLISFYFRARDSVMKINNLSPQLQVLINMEMRQKDMELMQKEMSEKMTSLEDKVDSIKTIIALPHDDDWRATTNRILNAIAFENGNYKDVKAWVYVELDNRAHVDINRRLKNKRKRMEDHGATKTEISSFTKLDVIQGNSMLKQIYIQIVKELAIKNNIDVSGL